MKDDYTANSHYPSLIRFALKGWVNVLFELGSERDSADAKLVPKLLQPSRGIEPQADCVASRRFLHCRVEYGESRSNFRSGSCTIERDRISPMFSLCFSWYTAGQMLAVKQ